MREIVLDTETTGLDPVSGHRLVEIACVEIFNLVPTGNFYHAYIDPKRDMPEEAYRIHGLSAEFLTGKPLFEHICRDFVDFIGDSRLIIHNAEFDMKFINHELQRVPMTILPMDRVFDTLPFARKKHPGASNSLDALCARYRIDNSKRTKHGALLDAEILAELYMELMGGRQRTLVLSAMAEKTTKTIVREVIARETALPDRLPDDILAAHEAFRHALGGAALWSQYIAD
jgi:DNA polymerase-3 subunit epsilon